MADSYKKLLKLAVLAVSLVLTIVVIGFCIKQFIEHNKVKETRSVATSPIKLKPNPKEFSDIRVWGSHPQDACLAFEQQGLLTYEYKQDQATGMYSCASPEIQIPDAKGIKTLKYVATGFKSKVTEYKLTLRLQKDDNTAENEAAKKAWAIYVAVLLENLFRIALVEYDLQALYNLEINNHFSVGYENKLNLVAKAKEQDGFIIYEFTAYGMPMVDGR